MEMDSATGSIYLGDSGVDTHHLIIWNTPSIFPRSWSHALLPSIKRSKQFVWFMMAGYTFTISSNPLLMLEPELLFLTNSLHMPCLVRRSVDAGLSSCQLHCCTTPWSTELRESLQWHNNASWEIHLKALIVRFWKRTPRQWVGEFVDAIGRPRSCKLGGSTQARVERHLEEVIEQDWRCTAM